MIQQNQDIFIVLCRVRDSGNAGSACRAMKSMGITNLILADCEAFDEEKVKSLAVHAFDIYQNAVRVPELSSALSGFSLSAGFTRRIGDRRKAISLSLSDFVEKCRARPEGKIALVFGNEKSGLSDAELAECGVAVHIPTSDECPSLNVSQAVQIACYEFARNPRRSENLTASELAPAAARSAIDASVERILASFSKAGFFRKSDSSYAGRFLRDMAERAYLSPDELEYLQTLLMKSSALSHGTNPRRRSSPPQSSK